MYFWTIGPPTFSVSVTTVSFNTVHSVYIHSDRGENNQLMLCLVAVQELLVIKTGVFLFKLQVIIFLQLETLNI